MTGVAGPLRMSFEVGCPVGHAFTLWTARIDTWWPPDHTVSGHPDRVVLESGVGGRIYERAADGVEHTWGAVTGWDPPSRLAYTWHLGRDPRAATDVEIRFVDQGDATRIEIEHTGWERVGSEWRDRNRIGWQTLLPHYLTAVENGAA